MTPPESRSTAHERVLDALREQIISGELAPGSRLSVYHLAERFGVSRTPVREAVLQLVRAGMLSIERNRGVVVRGLSVHDIHEIFDMRLLLEVPAAGFAAGLRDPALADGLYGLLAVMRESIAAGDLTRFVDTDRELHGMILRATGNERLVRQIEELRDATQAMGASTFNRTRRLQQVEEEHVPIVQAIGNGDRRAAEDAMRAHLLETARLLVAQTAEMTGEALPSPWVFTDGQGVPAHDHG